MGESLSEIQNCLLDLVKWYHDFCTINHLRYYLLGGSILGSVRHRGFIPWDDDIDVGMPRKDYEAFLQLTEGRLTEHYISESFHSGNADFVVPFAKLYDTETTLVEKRRVPCKRGVYIDVFPLDGFSEAKNTCIQYKLFRFRKNLLSLINAATDEHRGRKKNLMIRIAHFIPCHVQFSRYLQNRIEKFCKKTDFDSASKVANLVGSRKEKEVMPREYFGTPKLYPFEDTMLYGPEKAHEYLSWLIGDYMALPPESERMPHLVSDCLFGESFLKKAAVKGK